MKEKSIVSKKAWQSWEDDQKTNPTPVNPQAYTYGYEAGFKAALGYTIQSYSAAILKENESLKSAIRGIFNEPYGCRMCDSGILRNKESEHWDDCPFLIAKKLIK